MKRKPFKLLQFIIVVFVLFTVILTTFFGIFSYQRFRDYAIDNLDEYGRLLCEGISFLAADSLFCEDYPSLEFVISEFSQRQSVIDVSIINNQNIVVGDIHHEHLGRIAPDDPCFNTDKTVSNLNMGESELSVTTAVKIEDIYLGRIILLLSLDNTEQHLNVLSKQLITYLLIFFVACFVIGIFLTRTITSPVGKLISSIHESSKGNYQIIHNNPWISELLELERSYNKMIKQLDDREEQLIFARNEAERANSAKSIFLANISHELRTPLNGVLGFASLLEDTGLNSEQRFLLEKITVSGETLTSIIRNLLDLIELESGNCKVSNTIFKIESLFLNLEQMSRIILADKPVKFSYSIEDCHRVEGDRERIEQILVLLLNNSVKFTDKGRITLKSYWDDGLVFEVGDTGIGIPEEELQQVFENLYQIETPQLKIYKGLGIGLSIVKMLVDLLDGTIEIKSRIGCGTDVIVRLPLSKCEELCSDNSDNIAEEQGDRVLLVEDEAINRMYLEMALKKHGYQVDGVTDGTTALQHFKTGKYCLVLMDIGLPGMNGIDTSIAIFKTEEYKRRPVAIIPVTASTEEETRKRCEEVGMTAFISKPVREGLLLEVMRSVLIS